MRISTKLIAVAIAAEAILISTGLGLAAVQSQAAWAVHGDLALAASAAAFPLLLAVLELFKIPAGYCLYTARWVMKPFAALLLVGGMVATFETVTMAGSTWFRSLQSGITAAQSDLTALRERRDGAGDRTNQVGEITAAIEAVDRQLRAASDTPEATAAAATLDDLTAETTLLHARRDQARGVFAAEWDAQTANNTARIESGNPQVAEQGRASQRSMPTRLDYVDARMDDWDASEGHLVRTRIAELEAERAAARANLDTARTAAVDRIGATMDALRDDRRRLQDDLAAALAADRQAQANGIALGAAIEAQRQMVAELAADSFIYDIAAKAYGVALHEVAEEQANVTTFWVVLGVGLAAALSTGLAAFIAACVAQERRAPGHVRALRSAVAKDRRIAARDRTIAALRMDLETLRRAPPKVEHVERVVYRYLPMARDLTGDGARGQLRAIETGETHAA